VPSGIGGIARIANRNKLHVELVCTRTKGNDCRLGNVTQDEHQTRRQNQTCKQRLHESTSFGKKETLKLRLLGAFANT